jgi:exopolysaccharide production protein ExoQ
LPLPNALGGVIGADRGRTLRGSRLGRLATDALWVAFIFVACYATTPVKDLALERYFWLGADAAVLAVLLYQTSKFVRILIDNLVLLSWPILACMSAVWSVAPGMSLYHGVQLLLTVLVGLYLCMHTSLERIMQLLFVALLATAVLSALYVVGSPDTSIGTGGEWLGVFPHKNVLGHMMALLIITGLCLFLQGWRPRLTAFGIAIGTALIVFSRSGVGLVAVAIALAPLPLAILLRTGWIAFGIGLGLLLIALSANLLAVELYHIDMVQYVLDWLGKDATLTGRTLLWEFGWEAYSERPWLGYGYKGYWEDPSTTARLLRLVIGQDLWFFHNNFIDVAVAFGTLGPIALVVGLGFAFFSTIRAFLQDPQYVKLWPILFLILVLVLTNVENPLFQNHSIHQLLFVVAVVGTQRLRRLDPAIRPNGHRAHP